MYFIRALTRWKYSDCINLKWYSSNLFPLLFIQKDKTKKKKNGMAQHRTISTRRPSQKWDGKSCWSSLAVFDIVSCMRHPRYIFFQLFLFQIFHDSFSVWCSFILFTVSIKFMFVVVVLLNFSSLFSYPKKIALWRHCNILFIL